MKYIDITGNTYGYWTVLELDEERSNSRRKYYICECQCGTVKSVVKDSLVGGKSISCGCYSAKCTRERNAKDYTGQRFGRLVAIKPTDKRVGSYVVWECKCDCGNTHYVATKCLGRSTNSCGCLQKEWYKKHGERHAEWLKKHSGELSPTWNPNLTDEDRKANEARSSDKQWRACSNRTKKRDNNTCQCCGYQSNKGIVSHHKNGWDNFKEQRYDDNNVVTLCIECHKLFHHIYGYGKNTEEQYIEFINDYKENTEVTYEVKVS